MCFILPTGEKPFKCLQCNKKFVSMGVLRQHLRTHTGVKEYVCTVCKASFTTNGSLTRHMRVHMTFKPFRCPVCLEAFRTASICKKHMQEHTNEGWCTLNVGKNRCRKRWDFKLKLLLHFSFYHNLCYVVRVEILIILVPWLGA